MEHRMIFHAVGAIILGVIVGVQTDSVVVGAFASAGFYWLAV